MKTLADLLLASGRADAVVADAVRLIERHVGSRAGLRGMGLKTGLTMVKAARPGIVERAVRRLLPEFAQALDPIYQAFRASARSDFADFLQQHSPQATAALLAVADRRIGQASPIAQSAYAKLRGSAEAELHAAMPALAELLARHLQV
ncbi:DUF6918 family protein [Sinimarinibacterium thermocellulolyticum]|uniref:Uncharacterized protein n=1 Tax=Sinimarinibacterium thermocellulolyticum TaxID=3170016 RepID=A0ABV2ABH5_9GAMM